MAIGRPVSSIVLTEDERLKLEELSRRRKTSQALALRARIILACGQGMTNGQTAKELKLCMPTVG